MVQSQQYDQNAGSWSISKSLLFIHYSANQSTKLPLVMFLVQPQQLDIAPSRGIFRAYRGEIYLPNILCCTYLLCSGNADTFSVTFNPWMIHDLLISFATDWLLLFYRNNIFIYKLPFINVVVVYGRQGSGGWVLLHFEEFGVSLVGFRASRSFYWAPLRDPELEIARLAPS